MKTEYLKIKLETKYAGKVRIERKLAAIYFAGYHQCLRWRDGWSGKEHFTTHCRSGMEDRRQISHTFFHHCFCNCQSDNQLFYRCIGQQNRKKKSAHHWMAHRHSRSVCVDVCRKLVVDRCG